MPRSKNIRSHKVYVCLKFSICIAKLPSRKVEPTSIHSSSVCESWFSEDGIIVSPVSKVWSTLPVEDSVTRMDGSRQTKRHLRMIWYKQTVISCSPQESEIGHGKEF